VQIQHDSINAFFANLFQRLLSVARLRDFISKQAQTFRISFAKFVGVVYDKDSYVLLCLHSIRPVVQKTNGSILPNRIGIVLLSNADNNTIRISVALRVPIAMNLSE
jgi:hypothetical protein